MPRGVPKPYKRPDFTEEGGKRIRWIQREDFGYSWEGKADLYEHRIRWYLQLLADHLDARTSTMKGRRRLEALMKSRERIETEIAALKKDLEEILEASPKS